MHVNYDELVEKSISDSIADPKSIKIDKQFGEGEMTTVAVKKGISVLTNDVLFNQDICVLPDQKGYQDYVWVFVCLSGNVFFTFHNRAFPIKTGHSALFIGGEEDICLKQEVKKDSRFKLVSVLIERDIFNAITGRKPEEIYQLSNLELSERNRQVPPAMRNVAEQLLLDDFEGVDSKLYFEAKVLEFIAYKLGILDKYRPVERKSESTYPSLVERVHHAAELLEQMMLDPPGIFDLCGTVGLNHNKLIQGFKGVFGQTPFEYLSTIRLQKAAKLIQSGEQNVTEAAFSVGYSNLSHFARIFRQEFGVNPKTYGKRREGCLKTK